MVLTRPREKEGATKGRKRGARWRVRKGLRNVSLECGLGAVKTRQSVSAAWREVRQVPFEDKAIEDKEPLQSCPMLMDMSCVPVTSRPIQ